MIRNGKPKFQELRAKSPEVFPARRSPSVISASKDASRTERTVYTSSNPSSTNNSVKFYTMRTTSSNKNVKEEIWNQQKRWKWIASEEWVDNGGRWPGGCRTDGDMGDKRWLPKHVETFSVRLYSNYITSIQDRSTGTPVSIHHSLWLPSSLTPALHTHHFSMSQPYVILTASHRLHCICYIPSQL